MKNYQVYLCGGMAKFGKENFEEGNKWRRHCQKRMDCESRYHIEVVNPNDYFNFIDEPRQYQTQSEVMRFALYKLRCSDLVVVNFNDPHSLGSMAEIAIAYDRGIPIIGLDETGKALHPWQITMCERIFGDIDTMLDYVRDFYLH